MLRNLFSHHPCSCLFMALNLGCCCCWWWCQCQTGGGKIFFIGRILKKRCGWNDLTISSSLRMLEGIWRRHYQDLHFAGNGKWHHTTKDSFKMRQVVCWSVKQIPPEERLSSRISKRAIWSSSWCDDQHLIFTKKILGIAFYIFAILLSCKVKNVIIDEKRMVFFCQQEKHFRVLYLSERFFPPICLIAWKMYTIGKVEPGLGVDANTTRNSYCN